MMKEGSNRFRVLKKENKMKEMRWTLAIIID